MLNLEQHSRISSEVGSNVGAKVKNIYEINENL